MQYLPPCPWGWAAEWRLAAAWADLAAWVRARPWSREQVAQRSGVLLSVGGSRRLAQSSELGRVVVVALVGQPALGRFAVQTPGGRRSRAAAGPAAPGQAGGQRRAWDNRRRQIRPIRMRSRACGTWRHHALPPCRRAPNFHSAALGLGGYHRLVDFTLPDGATLVRSVGAGSVFEVAIVQHDGRQCVCKRLKLRMLDEPAGLRQMQREAALLERAEHPSVPELLAFGRDDAGPFILESGFEAPSLRTLVDGYEAQRGKRLPARQLRGLMVASFTALGELHALESEGEPLELVHGDLGPDHVMVGRGAVYFIDFGMSRWRGMSPPADPAERGTLPFVAPEVARGEQPPSQAGDVFALAASFAFAALGRDPIAVEGSAARLVEIAERGLDLSALAASESVDETSRDALRSALAYDLADRTTEAAAVLALLGAS